MAAVINTADLPGKTSRQFEGYHYGAVDVSFFVSATPPGRGPSLHTHPYAEVFVVQAGNLTFVVGDETIEAGAGQIVIAPAGVAHKFTNTGSGIAQHLDIHTSAKMETTWLET
ncbi:MAG TPA: cupin domain-containing protein [Roseiflexaceae bacterium]|nr:cupin domain-containing protein [Roseiflexaceae bacterium]